MTMTSWVLHLMMIAGISQEIQSNRNRSDTYILQQSCEFCGGQSSVFFTEY